MSDNKKYYYLKLKENFFDREEIKIIKGMEKGDTYVCILLEIYLRSLKREGKLMMTDRIPFSLATLSALLGRTQDEVKFAIEVFEEFELLQVLDSGAMFASDIQDFIGHGSTEGERKARYRKRIKEAEKQRVGHCPDKRPPELEIEKELEIETYTENKNVRVSVSEQAVKPLLLSKAVKIAEYWQAKRGGVVVVDFALCRRLNNLSGLYTYDEVKGAVETLVAVLETPKELRWYKHEPTLFSFFEKRSTFERFLNSSISDFMTSKKAPEQTTLSQFEA